VGGVRGVCAETKHDDIVAAFKAFTAREDISVILITQSVCSPARSSASRFLVTPVLVGCLSPLSLSRLWRCVRNTVRLGASSSQIAGDIRYLLNAYDKVIPTVLEIPSKDKPYREESDPIMQRVLKLMGTDRY
jgi:vacuolar-type H+-ATPase subunit F/Vma7